MATHVTADLSMNWHSQCCSSVANHHSHSRVVVACAMMLPPMGLTDGPANMDPPSRLAATTCRHHMGTD